MSYAWNWKGRDRVTGVVEGFYTTGAGYPTVNELKDHVEHHYRGLEFVSAEPADGPPKAVLRPVNPRHFQCEVLDLVRRELGGRRIPRPFGDMAAVRRRLAGLAPVAPVGSVPSRLSAVPSRLARPTR